MCADLSLYVCQYENVNKLDFPKFANNLFLGGWMGGHLHDLLIWKCELTGFSKNVQMRTKLLSHGLPPTYFSNQFECVGQHDLPIWKCDFQRMYKCGPNWFSKVCQ